MTSADDPTDVTALRKSVASAFWDAEAVKVNLAQPFELASGNRSPIYINCRLLISSPEFMRLFTRAARAVLGAAGVEVEAVAGGETAGIPYAAYLARDWDRSMLYVRKKEKGYGIASKVEGRLGSGWRVLLVEDLVTDGGSKVGFIDALRAAGAELSDALVVFDRQQGGGAVLAEHGVRLHSVTDLATSLSVGEQRNALTPEERSEIDAYFADPESWHQARGFTFDVT